MRIEYIKPRIRLKAKCTVHKNGKLGFSKTAVEKLGITHGSHVKIGQDADDPNYKVLYMVVTNEEVDESYKVQKAGSYYYLNTTGLFDQLGVNYEVLKVIYDIEDFVWEEVKMFRLNGREMERRQHKS